MEVTIKKNDSFSELMKIVAMNPTDLQEKIIKGLESIGFLQDYTQEVGKTIQEIIEEYNDDTFEEVLTSVFPNAVHIQNDELNAFFGGLVIWGDGSEMICEECGCEMEGETEGCWGQEWTNWDCSNPECENGITNEPDWDTMPGGYDDI